MVLDRPGPENDRLVAQHLVNVQLLRLKELQLSISSTDMKPYIINVRTSFRIVVWVHNDLVVSLSLSNMVKTLLSFIADFTKSHTRHVF